MENLSRISHLFIMIFLYNFSTDMVSPATTDVTMSALCPGEDECSLAIYLTGIQNLITGLGTIVMNPLIGNLSDIYGRKAMLTVPMCLTIIPFAILAYNRTREYFYAYYVLKILTAMICQGSVHCLALAYVADNIPENRRASIFAILSGITSSANLCGNLSTRFISSASTFLVASLLAVIATIYMMVFLPESIRDEGVANLINTSEEANVTLLDEDKDSRKNVKIFKTMPSSGDFVSLFRSNFTFVQVAIVVFFSHLGDVALKAALMYYLKALFQFNKNQFADLMVIRGIAETISQILLMPLLVPVIGVQKLLSIGLFFNCVLMFLDSIAWSSWVPYVAAMFSLLAIFAQPCLRSIASNQVGSSEQGKAQGCISGVDSFATIISPLIFSPLTALFLSANPPFHFPGFSIACCGFALMIAFTQSIMIKAAPPISNLEVDNHICVEP